MDNSIPKKNEHKPTSILSHTGTFRKKKRVLAKMKTYPRLTRDSALPHHQIHLPIWKRLWLSHKTLKHPKITIKIQKKKKKDKFKHRGRDDFTNMRMILPPRLSLLHETATRNACRHVSSLKNRFLFFLLNAERLRLPQLRNVGLI